MPTFGDFLHAQYFLKIPTPTIPFTSKTVLITGANRGLGKETAKHIVRLGADKVILACRSLANGESTKREIETSLKLKHSAAKVLEVWELDLESRASIASFVHRANALERLDVVINNAGIHSMGSGGFKLVYGTERSLAVNTIGTFLLAFQLFPKMRETATKYGTTPVMTTVSSALYEDAKYPEGYTGDIFAWCRDERNVDKMRQYNLSKLVQIYILIRLSTLIDPPSAGNTHPIVINSLDPCFCKTGLGGELSGPLKIFMKVFQALTARTAEEGSRLVVQTASAARETHGTYMRCGEVREYLPIALDEKRGKRAWEALVKRLEDEQPGVLACLERGA